MYPLHLCFHAIFTSCTVKLRTGRATPPQWMALVLNLVGRLRLVWCGSPRYLSPTCLNMDFVCSWSPDPSLLDKQREPILNTGRVLSWTRSKSLSKRGDLESTGRPWASYRCIQQCCPDNNSRPPFLVIATR